jgi:hypothetical protein
METTKKPVKPYPAELRERAVRMVREHASEHASEWAAMRSIAEKVGCTCIFRGKAAGDSWGKRPLSPEQAGHRFHGKSATLG